MSQGGAAKPRGMWVLMRGARVLRSKAWGCGANARQLPHQDRSHLVIQVAFFLPAIPQAPVVPSYARQPRKAEQHRDSASRAEPDSTIGVLFLTRLEKVLASPSGNPA